MKQRQKDTQDNITNYSKRICQYGKSCYRKNPIHFQEFTHPHLNNILLKGKDSDNNYRIPDEFNQSRDIILIQLGFVEKHFKTPKLKEPAAKKPRQDDPTAGSSTDVDVEEGVTKLQVAADVKVEPKTGLPSKKIIEEPEKILDPVDLVTEAKKSPAAESSRPSQSVEAPTKDTLEEPKDKKPVRLVENDLTKFCPQIEDFVHVIRPKGESGKKLEASAPYNFFLTAITSSPATHNEDLTITLQEILDSSLGDLESSLQINFMVDVGWLLGHYYFAGHDQKPLLIVHGEDTPELSNIGSVRKNVTAIKVRMSSPFATHHTKMMIFWYKDRSIRVVVSTANLYEDDWHNRTQGLWISPTCPEMVDSPNSAAGESPTGFRADLIKYLNSYNLPRLQEWVSRVQNANFEKINVFLICSTPGGHQTLQHGPLYGHLKLGSLLSKHSSLVQDSCPVIAQSSSIGSLGQNINSWIHTDIGLSMSKDSGPPRLRKTPHFKMIFPSYNNVKNSHDGMLGGGCLPYRRDNHIKQPWLENHLQIWKADKRHRSQAMPHIKTYFRYSDEGVYWFCLTSANLSKAAWGSINKGSKLEQILRVMNYEAGVLFLPKFVTKTNTFPLKAGGAVPPFPVPYDLPLTPFSIDDKPFFMDYLL